MDMSYEKQPPPDTLPTLTFDVALYEHYLENSNLSPKEKHEFLRTLWDLICTFVQVGWGVEPSQQVIEDFCMDNDIPDLESMFEEPLSVPFNRNVKLEERGGMNA
jgi:hypothetical protein